MSDEYLRTEEELLAYAPIENYCILRESSSPRMGLVVHVDETGQIFACADDDEERVGRHIRFLEAAGCPVFEDVAELDRYRAEHFQRVRRTYERSDEQGGSRP